MKNKIKISLFYTVMVELFLFSFFYSPIANAEIATTTASSTPLLVDTEATSTSMLETQQATSTPVLPTLAESEERVREYFNDDPIMIKIAKCESGFRQYNNDGSVMISKNGLYIGVFQIDPKIHNDFAKSMGMDIFTLDGNLAYAKYLKSRSGANPWPACFRSTINLTLNLKLGMTHDQIKTVQQILNNAGFTISKSGFGSQGNETTYFGSLTRAALKRFQCEKGIVCQGSENTTGYGLVGPKTRAALIKAASSN
jgi:hypothetical protein